MTNEQAPETTVIFGTAWNPHSRGIYAADFDRAKGAWLSPPRLLAEWESPGFLLKHPEKPILYVSGGPDRSSLASLSAFRMEENNLIHLNTVPTGGGMVTYAALDSSGGFLVTADYQDGSVGVFALQDDGQVGERLAIHDQGTGAGAHPRQDAAHPHYVALSPGGRFVIVPDLGANALFVYPVEANPPYLGSPERIDCPPASGPRHMKFSADGQFAWVVNELDMTVSTYRWNEKTGEMKLLSRADALPEVLAAAESVNTASEIQVHPSGKFLYTGNRGHDSISVFRINDENGSLTRIEVEPIRGTWPRHFSVDSRGKWLVCAGQHSSTVGIFAIDPESGLLTYQRRSILPVPGPTWVEIMD